MQIVKILLLCFVFAGCSSTNEIQKVQTNSSIEQKEIYNVNNQYSYLTLKALEKESGSYQPAAFLINGIWFHHYKKEPLLLTVSEGCFNIRVSSVSKLPYVIEGLHISSGDSVVIDIKMEDDLSPLID